MVRFLSLLLSVSKGLAAHYVYRSRKPGCDISVFCTEIGLTSNAISFHLSVIFYL